MKIIFSTVTLLGLIVFGVSCNNIISKPHDLKYSDNTISIEYYTQGCTKAPAINWGDKKGTFALNKTYRGLSINKENGVISWTNDFFENNKNIKVIAKNYLGKTYTYINFSSKFNQQFLSKIDIDSVTASPIEDVIIKIEDSEKVKMNITINGMTEIIEANFSINNGKLTFSNYTIDNLINGKDIIVLKLKPLKGKSNFEGKILKSKLVNDKIKTNYSSHIN